MLQALTDPPMKQGLYESPLLKSSTEKAETPIADLDLSVGSRPGQVVGTPGSTSSRQGLVEGTQGVPSGIGNTNGLIDQKLKPIDGGADSQKSNSSNTSLFVVNSAGDVGSPQHSDSTEHQRPILLEEHLNRVGVGSHKSKVVVPGGHQGSSQETGGLVTILFSFVYHWSN